MNGKRASLGVLLLIVCSVNVQAANNGGQIRFSGQVVEAACDVGRQIPGDVASGSRPLKVSSVVSLNVDTQANACREGRMPFSTSYQPLATRQTTAQGTVIITYN